MSEPSSACAHESLYGGAERGVWTCDGCGETISDHAEALAALCSRAGTPCATGLLKVIDTLARQLDALRRPSGPGLQQGRTE